MFLCVKDGNMKKKNNPLKKYIDEINAVLEIDKAFCEITPPVNQPKKGSKNEIYQLFKKFIKNVG